MAVKITNVKITTSYSWQNLKQVADWNAVKNTNANWEQPLQTTNVGQQIFIEVEVIENNWQTIKQLFSSWQDIKNNFTNWLGLKNW